MENEKLKMENYKQTELGLIPDDWEVKKLGEVIKLGNGKDYKHLNSGNIPVYGTGGIITYVDKYLFNGKSVGIGRKGSIDKPVLLDGKFWTVDTLFYVKEFFNSDIDFIYNSFLKIPWLKYNEATGLPSLSQNIINNLKIPLPPLPEQKKIADCLSTWDCAIEKQSQLINALTQRKKALMQQLLTGKKRLPGFSGEWKEVSLIELADFRRGSFPQPYGLPEWYDNENGEPFIQVYDVGDNFNLKPTTKSKISELAQVQSVFIKKGTLIVTLQGSIGKVAITNYDAYIDRTLLLFSSFKMKVDIYFIMYQIHNLFNIEKEKAPGGIIKTITKEVLSNFKIKLPSFEEQTAIAEILATADRELQLQKEKLAQLQTQKKGLMQVLLTGKKRLIN